MRPVTEALRVGGGTGSQRSDSVGLVIRGGDDAAGGIGFAGEVADQIVSVSERIGRAAPLRQGAPLSS